MDRHDNVEIFKDTMHRIKRDPLLSSAVAESIRKERLICDKDDYTPSSDVLYNEKARVLISGKRTLEAAAGYRGMKTAVLNFASAVSPGGGVTSGSFAQEESICRCTTLYPCLKTDYLWKNFYEVHRNSFDRSNTDDTIYTPSVIVFKSDDLHPVMLEREYWYPVNIITTAAPDLRWPSYPGERGCIAPADDELKALHTKRAERILSIAAGEGNEAVVLGAFGCGAFHNPPRVVAEAFRDVIEKNFLYKFKVIEFAIYTNPYKGEGENIKVFSDVFGVKR